MSAPLDLKKLAHDLSGEVQGRQVVCPGPNHSRRDRSLAVRPDADAPGGFTVFSHAGDDFALCRDYVAQRLGLDLDAWRTQSRERRPAPVFTVPAAGSDADRAARIARAAALWAEAVPARGTIAERYLASRELELPDGDALRLHARCPWRDAGEDRTLFVPCMVAALRSVADDTITGAHRTRLAADGTKLGRRMLGVAAGAAVKLDADDAVTHGLTIAEGIETALAGRQLGFRPAWALGSAGAIAAFPVLGGVEPMPVLADGPKGRPTVNGPLLAALVRRWAPAIAFVELIGPRPGEGAVQGFTFGRCRGLVEGVLAAAGVPARMVAPQVWKRATGIPPGREGAKDLARAEACRRWPGMAERFAAKGSDGLAEAGLIAVGGMAREAGR